MDKPERRFQPFNRANTPSLPLAGRKAWYARHQRFMELECIGSIHYTDHFTRDKRLVVDHHIIQTALEVF